MSEPFETLHSSATLTLDAVQVGGRQRLSLGLVCGDPLVLGLLGARHVACAPPLLQVVAAGGDPGERRMFGWRQLRSRAGALR